MNAETSKIESEDNILDRNGWQASDTSILHLKVTPVINHSADSKCVQLSLNNHNSTSNSAV